MPSSGSNSAWAPFRHRLFAAMWGATLAYPTLAYPTLAYPTLAYPTLARRARCWSRSSTTRAPEARTS